jgi:uncharacterized protein involved in type VI secretion and phage assembly
MSDVMDKAVERLAQRAASTYYGKYRGVVTDNKDDEGLCRIRAQVPAILGDHPCAWALPCAPFAGDGHGHVMLPAIGANVWIEFEAGRLDSPIWSGGFWSGGQRPTPDAPETRMIVSEKNHRIVFDDNAGTIEILHDSGPKITLSATEILLSCGLCTIAIGAEAITMNDGVIKLGKAGVSLAMGAMAFGVPP